jgi:hypothetical protein
MISFGEDILFADWQAFRSDATSARLDQDSGAQLIKAESIISL